MNIQPRGDRTWRLVWQAGRDPATGRWRRVTETVHGTRRQAEQRWVERQREIERGIGATWQGITLADLWDRWLAAKMDLEPSTRTSYEGLGRTHILPVLGAARVDKLTPLDIQHALTVWQTAPRADGKPGTLSPRTVAYCRTLVIALLDQAVRWQLVPTNVARVVDAPRQRPKRHGPDDWWTVAQAQAFLRTAGPHRWAIAFLLALSGGLREGEILALRWQDVDWSARAVTITQTLKRSRTGYVIGPPKTAASQRTVALDTQVMHALREHRRAQVQTRLRVGADYHDHDLVVATALGTPLLPSNLRRVFARLCQAAGVPRIRFHDLRHTHASWLVAQGVDIRTVADRLGHAAVSFTLQTYVHSRLDHQRAAADQLSAHLWHDDDPARPKP